MNETDELNALAVRAYAQYAVHCENWPAFRASVGQMSDLSRTARILVATRDRQLVGAVAYLSPMAAKSTVFDPAWAVMRMLSVAPDMRGKGIGKALAVSCIRLAMDDKVPAIALHTSPIMTQAVAMYTGMGFAFSHAAPSAFGLRYAVYLKHFGNQMRLVSDLP